MPIQKRRIVYLSDVEWDLVKRRAERAGISASELLRDLVRAAPAPGFGNPASRSEAGQRHG